MKNTLREKINNWIAFSKSIQNIYLKIIYLEQNNLTNLDEYKTLLEVLKDAIKFERKAFNELNINVDNVRQIKAITENNTDELFENICLELSNDLSTMRRSNMLDDYLLKNNNFADTMPVTNIIELLNKASYIKEVEEVKYATEFINILNWNFIRTIDEEIPLTDNKKLKNYLISLKYRIIASNPEYEDNYTYFNYHILPIKQLDSNFYDINKKVWDEYKDLNRNNIRITYEEDLLSMYCYTDDLLKDYTNYRDFTRMKLLNKARLASILDIEFLDYIRDETFSMIPNSKVHNKALAAHIETLTYSYDLLEKQKK